MLAKKNAKDIRRKKEAGYSMMEILIVLAIMAVIAALVGPRLFNQLDNSKVTAAKTQIRTLESALSTMRLELGRYPTEAEGLELLVNRPTDEQTRSVWRGPYLDNDIPEDPWGNPYHYALPESDFAGYDARPIVYSFGQDNQPGGEGPNADIGRLDKLSSQPSE